MANGRTPRVRVRDAMPLYMTPEEFGAYAAKVDNLSISMAGMGQKIDDLSTKIDSRSRPQYNLIINGFTVLLVILGGIGSYLYIPLYSKVDTLAHDTFQTFMPKEIVDEKIRLMSDAAKERERFLASAAEERSRQISDRRDDWQRNMETHLNKVESREQVMEDKVVPRDEHAQHWEQEKSDVANLQKQVDVLSDNFKQLFPLHDVIQNMQRKLEILEDGNHDAPNQSSGH